MIKIKISTRIVFILKNRVIKIPIDKRGYLQGKNENKVWDKYKDSGILAPLIWERFGVVCQERAEHIKSIDDDKVMEVKSIIPQFNFNNCDLYNPKNWGQYKGKLVLLDYGIDESISNMYK